VLVGPSNHAIRVWAVGPLSIAIGAAIIVGFLTPAASATAMPEAGYLPIPTKLATAGVKDMVRISDARMSGTAYGTIVLHVAPDAASGGPLGLVESGDRIRLSVARKSIELLVDAETLERRRTLRVAPGPVTARRGYARLYQEQILQADEGCDFRVLTGSDLKEPSATQSQDEPAAS